MTSSCQSLCLPHLRHLGGNPKDPLGATALKLRKTTPVEMAEHLKKVETIGSEFGSQNFRQSHAQAGHFKALLLNITIFP